VIARRWLLAGLASLAACKRGDDGTAPKAGSLPPLTLRDDTPDLLLTYLDERGDFHTAQRPDEVPAAFRNPVRVVVTTRDEGSATSLLYVADLTQKRPDGTYAVVSMPRTQWDTLADQKRTPSRPSQPPATAQPTAAQPTAPAPGGRRVILYGASWCGPCHDVQEYLKARGVAFDYHDIDVDDAARKEMNAKVDRAGLRKGPIPVIDVGGRILIGYDPASLGRALKAIAGDSSAL